MPRTILFADDNPHARRMGAQFLADLGYGVTTVEDGPAALRALAAERPQLVIADAALPGIAAAELRRQLAAAGELPRVPLLLLVGALGQPRPELLAGADGVLRKPLSSAGIESWLGRIFPDGGVTGGAGGAGAGAAAPLGPRAALLEALRAAVAGV